MKGHWRIISQRLRPKEIDLWPPSTSFFSLDCFFLDTYLIFLLNIRFPPEYTASPPSLTGSFFDIPGFYLIQEPDLSFWSNIAETHTGQCTIVPWAVAWGIRFCRTVARFCTLCKSESTRTCENCTCFSCNSSMSVCFLTRATCKKVWHESYT